VYSIKDFVEESLVQIAEGLQAAQERVQELDVKIIPGAYSDGGRQTEIDFDLAVTTSEVSKAGGEKRGSLEIMFFKASAGGESSTSVENLAVNRIRFTVSAVLPAADKGRNKPRRRKETAKVINPGIAL
jgi:hypothetical protein